MSTVKEHTRELRTDILDSAIEQFSLQYFHITKKFKIINRNNCKKTNANLYRQKDEQKHYLET